MQSTDAAVVPKATSFVRPPPPRRPDDAASPAKLNLITPTPTTPQILQQVQSTVPSHHKAAVFGTNNTHKASLEEQKALCRRLGYDERSFLSETNRRLPPMLYTFPGSGNTWCRLLIEHATGIYTGSVYNDDSLLKALPGEFTCSWTVSAVKVHPHTHHFNELRAGTFGSDNNKCNKGSVKRFERAILLLRDPFDSIWSEFQRRVSQSHVSGVRKAGFNWHRWQANAANLAHAYADTWSIEHMGIERHFKPEDILYLRYEDLKNEAKRVEALQKLVQFLRFPSQDKQKLECAFVLAENKAAHRQVTGGENEFMTKDIAYRPEIACRMWSLFGKWAQPHGYQPWKGLDCTGYHSIPRINVGPQGEYDKKWVKPGQKMIDFRQNITTEQLQEERQMLQQFEQNRHQQRNKRGKGGGGGKKKGGRQKSLQQLMEGPESLA